MSGRNRSKGDRGAKPVDEFIAALKQETAARVVQ